MINNQRVLALIPARGGSKRLPGKNIKPLAGKPLIAWSIEFAQQQPEIDDIVVSTDAAEIAEVARRFGVNVPWLRPTELGSDSANSIDVIKDALVAQANNGFHYEYLVLLQPTSPFRNPDMLKEALIRCHNAHGAPVVAFGKAKTHPCWCFKQDCDGHLSRYAELDPTITRSQDLPLALEITGNLYVIGTQRILDGGGFFDADMQAVISNERTYDIDIDDELDWVQAESIARSLATRDAI